MLLGSGGVFAQPVDVDIDVSSIKDPMLSPAKDGYRVTTRPGDVAKLDFPLVATSEIDGTISVVSCVRCQKRADITSGDGSRQKKRGPATI